MRIPRRRKPEIEQEENPDFKGKNTPEQKIKEQEEDIPSEMDGDDGIFENLFDDGDGPFRIDEDSLGEDDTGDSIIDDPLTELPWDFDEEDKSEKVNPNPILYDDDIDEKDITYEYAPERSYFFVFGPSAVGKTVIIGSIFRYLKQVRGVLGDKLMNINKGKELHEIRGNQLLNELTETNIENKFPRGTAIVTALHSIPRHINFKFTPARHKKPEFEFCFMDMAGEDLAKIDFSNKGGKLPLSIRTYVEDLPKENLCFIYVIDPLFEAAKKIEQTQLFEAFIHLIDNNNHDDTPILLLVSKWDTVKEYDDVTDYLKNEFEDIWGYVNQVGRKFSLAEFSIGSVTNQNTTIATYNPEYPERVFKWMYKTQTGVDLEDKTKGGSDNWLTRLINKFS